MHGEKHSTATPTLRRLLNRRDLFGGSVIVAGMPILGASFLRSAAAQVRPKSMDEGTPGAAPVGTPVDATAANSLTFAGLQLETLGDAQLSIKDGTAIVSSLGGPEDGFGIDVGNSEGVHWLLEIPESTVGAYMVARSIGRLDGVDNSVLTESRFDMTETGFLVTPNYEPLGSRSFNLRLIRNGGIVFEQGEMTGTISVNAPPDALAKIKCCNHDPHGWSYRGKPSLQFPTDLGIIEADSFIIQAESPQRNVDYISRIEEVTSGIPEIRITEAAVMAFVRQPHTSLGTATLHAELRGLTVANIGLSGDDGVRIGLEGIPILPRLSAGVEVKLEPLSFDADPAQLRISATGTANEIAGQQLGSVTIQNEGEGTGIFLDVSGTGASEAFIAVGTGEPNQIHPVLAQGVVGMLERSSIRIIGCGISTSLSIAPQAFYFEWEEETTIRLTDGTNLVGTKAWFLVPEHMREVEHVASFSMAIAGLSALTISDEQVHGI